jgi:hypothetical protein
MTPLLVLSTTNKPKTQAVAWAETSTCVKFAVRIWTRTAATATPSSSDDEQELVVEVQRISGCGFLFLQVAKTVLRAAKNMVAASKSSTAAAKRCSLTPRPMPLSLPPLRDEEVERCTTEVLEIAHRDLQPGMRTDAHVLALESLAKLSSETSSSSNKSSPCRDMCVRKILQNDSDLLSVLVNLIECARLRGQDDDGDESEEQDEECRTSLAREQYDLMHRHALTTLANCLRHRCSTNAAETQQQQHVLLQSDALLHALVRDVGAASTRPHEAAAACQCLRALLSLCGSSNVDTNASSVKDRVVQMGVQVHLSHVTASNASSSKPLCCRHALLETECRRLLQTLQ